MERVKCSVRDVSAADRGMLVLLAEETLHPLAEGSGHPERYHTAELLELLERADVFVAEAEGKMAGFVAVEAEDDALALRCMCVRPAAWPISSSTGPRAWPSTAACAGSRRSCPPATTPPCACIAATTSCRPRYRSSARWWS